MKRINPQFDNSIWWVLVFWFILVFFCGYLTGQMETSAQQPQYKLEN
jgi:hypothetical protein